MHQSVEVARFNKMRMWESAKIKNAMECGCKCQSPDINVYVYIRSSLHFVFLQNSHRHIVQDPTVHQGAKKMKNTRNLVAFYEFLNIACHESPSEGIFGSFKLQTFF